MEGRCEESTVREPVRFFRDDVRRRKIRRGDLGCPPVPIFDDNRDLCVNLRDLLRGGGFRPASPRIKARRSKGFGCRAGSSGSTGDPVRDGGAVFRRAWDVDPATRVIPIGGHRDEMGPIVEGGAAG